MIESSPTCSSTGSTESTLNSRRKRPSTKRRYKKSSDIEVANRRAFHEAAWAQRCCQECGAFGDYQSHHVTEKSELRRRGRMDLVWDTRNSMRVCPDCHRRHTIGMDRIKLQHLSDDHYQFAFYLMGAAAHSYLRRMYNGRDPRLDEYLEKWEVENGTGTAESNTASSV